MDKHVIRLPDIGEGVAEAEIVAWHIKLGDRIEEDQATVDVMTDKATVEMTSPVAGVVVALHGEVGQMMPVGSPLIELALDGGDDEPGGAALAHARSDAAPVNAPHDAAPAGQPGGNAPAQASRGDAPADAPADAMDGPETPTLPETIATQHLPAVPPQPAPAAAARPLPEPAPRHAPERASKPASQPAPRSAPERASEPASQPASAAAEPPLAAPATRRRARELGIVLQDVPGTGPEGRVTPEDLDGFVARREAGVEPPRLDDAAASTGIHEIRIIGLRRRIAERMQDAKRRIPHFGYVEEFDLTELEALRRDLNDNRSGDRPRLTLLPFFMRAVVRLAPQFPTINARYDDDAGILRTHDAVHVGVATQTAGGLLVPVVRHAETLDLWQSARELERVTRAARDGSATREELSGSTITLTSLGKLGGVSATPVINHPEVAIIGPNKLIERPMVIGGQIAIRTMMNVSSSFDHRIIDGYDAARFIQALKRLIERPALLFIPQD